MSSFIITLQQDLFSQIVTPQPEQRDSISERGIRILFIGFLLVLLTAGNGQAAGVQETGIKNQDLRSNNAGISELQPQVLFNRGNYMMEEQNFVQALETFRSIEKQGYAAGPLFYNIGISYAYLDSLGMASYYFHKSAGYRDTDHLAGTGISFIEDQMRKKGTFIRGLPWYSFTDRFLFGINYSKWIIRGLILLNTGVMILILGWHYRPNRYFVSTGAVIAVTGLFIILAGSTLDIWSNNYDQAIVTESRVPVYPEPGNEIFSPTGDKTAMEGMPDLAYEGYSVTLNRRISRGQNDWVYIRMRNGIAGWVPESSIRIL